MYSQNPYCRTFICSAIFPTILQFITYLGRLQGVLSGFLIFVGLPHLSQTFRPVLVHNDKFVVPLMRAVLLGRPSARNRHRPAGQTVLRTVSAAPPPAAASGGRPCGPTDPPRDAARPLSRRPAAYPPGRSDHPHHCTLSSGCRRPLSG